ncbi:MAG TPA: chromosome segregation protein SMC [Bacteroidetes bacterium]|nr:chromosome segregation protein SMC [Bacteroidota bacterium]
MRLNTLEIKGFKSFADQTVINFHEDVIGVVGPNGSGKSNVVDAMRWVLGEQKSKELRLDKMTSIIFNGTKKRKQGGMAQVTLTFENTKNLLPTEYNTVAITRRLYRSGESEYLLNGVTCRLKDITNLFMDTGIGSNSYAIIALGMVDEILADKDNARRRMFEQAAGISKYKRRKKQTLNKLKSTTEDLDRVEDLLFEINNNLSTLEKQAKRTKRYFELKNQYKELSIQLAAYKNHLLKKQYDELQKKLTQEEDNYRQTEVEQRQWEAKLEAERKGNLDKEKELSEKQKEVNELVGRIRDKENEKRVLEERLNFIEQNKSKANAQILIAKSRMESLGTEIEDYRQTVNEDKRLEAKLEEQLDAAEERLNKIKESHGALKSELDEIMSGQQAVERELFELEKQKAINNNQIENLKRDIEHSQEEAKSRGTENATLKHKIAEQEKEEKKLTKELEALQTAEEKRQAEIEKGEAKLQELTSKVQKIHRDLDSKRNEYKLTKSMVENFEGFPESIRFLSNKKNWNKKAPLFSDLIYVEAGYRVAIENYLDKYLNYFVVDNVEEAFNAIKLLNRAQKGKANFFILDAFKDYSPPIAMIPGGYKQGIDLVQCDPNFRNLASYLLENVVVTDNEEAARELPGDNLVLLAKSGRFIQKKFSLSGGSVGLFEGKKIGRKKNMEVLEKAIKSSAKEEDLLSNEIYKLKSALEALRAKDNRREIQELRNLLNKVSQERISLAARLESFENYLKDVGARNTQASDRIKELEEANRNFEELLNNKASLAEKARDNISNTDVSFRKAAEELSQASADFNNKNIEFIRQQNKVSAFQRELSFREKQLDEAKASYTANMQALDESGGEIGEINDNIERLQKELLADYEIKKEKEGKLSQAEQSFFKARGGIHEIEDKLRSLGKKGQDIQILINNLKNKFSDTKYQISAVAERLNIEFGISMEDEAVLAVDPTEAENVNRTEMQGKVDRLKIRLENYGEINPLAVEAYDEMKERHDNISEQRDDILKAKDDLLETIKEIEETATAQFLESFEKVRLYFIDVFRTLFSEEDKADLILLEPDNPLESRIEIVAKPKGKRPQSISQLSGGEKTLTATALLFALYLLKPAPFCIFDEVDAPLDDANIEKFNNIIRKFSADSQFIIVTHNKQTMAAVDTIYGVFMAEQGVSAVTQVDFRDLEHEAVLETVEG